MPASLSSKNISLSALVGNDAFSPITAVAGYAAGGTTGSFVNTVDKFAFPSDARTTLGTGLSSVINELAGFSNPNVAGYAAGGSTSAGRFDTVDKFAFPSDSRSTLGTGLSENLSSSRGFFDTAVAGYVAGGDGDTSGPQTSKVEKFAFPSDSRTTLGTGLSVGRNDAGAMENVAVAGYVGGGRQSTDFSVVDKFAFPSDSRTTLATGLSVGRRDLEGFANDAVAGYFAGGATSSPVAKYSTVDKFAFPSDSRTTLATGLSAARSDSGSFDNSLVAGYVAGGLEGSQVTTVDKFEFPSDTRTTLATGLSSAREELAGFSNG